MSNYENLSNEQKELVKYWINKIASSPLSETKEMFFEKYLSPTPIIEAGKWYKSDLGHLWFVEEVDHNRKQECVGNTCKSYGFGKSGKWYGSDWRCLEDSNSIYTEAPREEVEARLIEEAKRRYQGAKIKPLNEHLFYKYHGKGVDLNFSDFDYDKKCLWVVSTERWRAIVFENGQWAEIIDLKDEIRDSIERLKKEIEILESKL